MEIRKYGDQIDWGSFAHEDQSCWEPFVQGDQFYGYHLSRGTGSGGPVRDQMGLVPNVSAKKLRKP